MRRLTMLVVVGMILSGLPGMGRVHAQGVYPQGDPGYGTVTLEVNFEPDPHTVQMTSGGSVNVSTAFGGVCQGVAAGFVASAPDYRVTYNGGPVNRLRLFFVGTGDTTLVIQAPGEQWFCDDDSSGGIHPLINFESPTSGEYNIWVGSAVRGDYVIGTLYITDQLLNPLAFDPLSGPPVVLPTATPGAQGLQPEMPPREPNQRPFELNPIFQFRDDDYKHTETVRTGGDVSLFAELNGICAGEAAGFVNRAPDFKVQFLPAAGESLRIMVLSEANTDTTLAIQAPDGGWYCNDDWNDTRARDPETEPLDLDPMVVFEPAQRGWYTIYVGSYDPGAFINAQVVFTRGQTTPAQIAYNPGGGPEAVPPTPTPINGPDPNAPPLFVREFPPTDPGYTGDPLNFDLNATRTDDRIAPVSTVPDCPLTIGFVPVNPWLSVKYTADVSRPVLRFFYISAQDTLLAVQDPQGNWRCDDNAGGSGDPLLDVPALSGTYKIWIGGPAPSGFVAGRFYITERDIYPVEFR
jgi:hypothetical protein